MEAGNVMQVLNERTGRWSPGQRVKRLNDGAPGVVKEPGPHGNVWVVWESSGLETVINALQIEAR